MVYTSAERIKAARDFTAMIVTSRRDGKKFIPQLLRLNAEYEKAISLDTGLDLARRIQAGKA